EFHLGEKFEAGLALVGTEVKALRMGRASIMEAFGKVRDGEAFLLNMDIPTYEHAGYSRHDPKRPRKLLLHAREIRRIEEWLRDKGHTVKPTTLYFNDRGIAKVAISLAKGKGHGDKREDLRKREQERDVRSEMARRAKVNRA
ncbi:MAG: SsrA-binding protein SmpB, partial [Planctomycetes bacterium]|nr:SsrA-binding protein SmpB [Planctomycetota bacterium]